MQGGGAEHQRAKPPPAAPVQRVQKDGRAKTKPKGAPHKTAVAQKGKRPPESREARIARLERQVPRAEVPHVHTLKLRVYVGSGCG